MGHEYKYWTKKNELHFNWKLPLEKISGRQQPLFILLTKPKHVLILKVRTILNATHAPKYEKCYIIFAVHQRLHQLSGMWKDHICLVTATGLRICNFIPIQTLYNQIRNIEKLNRSESHLQSLASGDSEWKA